MDEYLSPDYRKLANRPNAPKGMTQSSFLPPGEIEMTGYDPSKYNISDISKIGFPSDFQMPAKASSLVQPSIETEQAPGVTTMARANTPLVTSSGKFKLTGDTAGSLIGEVQKWNTALKSLEFNPDGGVRLESHPMPQVPEKPVGEIRGTEREPQQLIETPITPTATPEPKGQSFWQKAGEFLTSPRAGYIAGQIGAALATNEGQRELGLFGAKLNLDIIYADYLKELKAGKSPEELLQGNYKVLPVEYRRAAVGEMRLEQEAAMKKEKFDMEKEAFGLDKTSQVLRDKYTEQLTSYQAKLEQGLLTKEEQIEQKNLDRAIGLALGEMNRDDWMGLGGGIAFNFRTGQYVMATAPDGEGGSGAPLGKLDTADFNQWEKWVSDNYIKEATEGRKQQYIKEQIAGGSSKKDAEEGAKSIDFLSYFKDPKTGMYDPRVIKANLQAGRKTEFDKDMAKYLLNAASGVHPLITQVQQSQQYQMNQPFQHIFGDEDPSKKGQTWEVKPGGFDAQGRVTSVIPVRLIKK